MEREHKPLGLLWASDSDEMRFQYRAYEGEKLTKLTLLKLYMALFDPLGLLMPFIMSARILYRDLWRLGCDWDDPVPEDVGKDWRKWMGDLNRLNDFSFKRCVNLQEGGFLAAFSDASKDAYGAAIYLVRSDAAVLLYARAGQQPGGAHHPIARVAGRGAGRGGRPRGGQGLRHPFRPG